MRGKLCQVKGGEEGYQVMGKGAQGEGEGVPGDGRRGGVRESRGKVRIV